MNHSLLMTGVATVNNTGLIETFAWRYFGVTKEGQCLLGENTNNTGNTRNTRNTEKIDDLEKLGEGK